MKGCRIMIVVLALLFGANCAAKRVPEAGKLREALRLSLRFQEETVEAPQGGVIPVFVVLENRSPEPIDVCLGEDEGYTMLDSDEARGRHSRSERPRCLKRLLLAPGGAIEIPKLLAVLDVGPGEVSISAWIQVVDPEQCGKRGCAEARIRSNPLPGLLVTGPRTPLEFSESDRS